MSFDYDYRRTCQFCKATAHHKQLVKYGVRHYAHFGCYLDRKSLRDLHPWQVLNFPSRELSERGLLDEAARIIETERQP